MLTEAFISLSPLFQRNYCLGLYLKVTNFRLIRKLNLCRNRRQVCVTFELENTSLSELGATNIV